MEKDSYETFEFITPNSPNNAEISPLFVLQEDGTILSLNREVQYVTQAEDGKENEEPCTVFDVSSQRYYVDANSTTELITIPDQFVTPTDEDSINSYLIQPESTAVSEQMETDVLIETNPEALETDEETTTISKSVHTGYTEITINNDQYQILEQRGWILLECYDKIFLLNTLGLHDITENEKLVSKLKSEVQAFNVTQIEELTDGQIDLRIEDQASDLKDVEIEELDKHEKSEIDEIQQLEVESIMEDNSVANPDVYGEAENEESNSTDNPEDTQSVKEGNQEEPISSPVSEEFESDMCNTLKIKTKYVFTDVPSKIYLGKTTAGKKLFAKVTKSKLNRIKNYKNIKLSCEKIKNYCTLTESQFISIVQDSIRECPHINEVNISEAETVIMQLLKISQIKEAIVGHKIVLTKILISTDAEGRTTNQQRPIIITGIINETDDGKEKFVYVPKMLQSLPHTDKKSDKGQIGSEVFDKTEPNHTINIFHVHVAESNKYGKLPNQTIQITKRKLSLTVLNDTKKRHADPIYACGACAAVFKSENTLKEHQENQCFADDALTIDTDKISTVSESYSTIEAGKKKWYACTQCEAKFTRLFNCQKHIKTHDIPNQNPDSDSKSGTETNNKTPKKVYKCSMCPSTYFHPSSLSKHIVKMHIHV